MNDTRTDISVSLINFLMSFQMVHLEEGQGWKPFVLKFEARKENEELHLFIGGLYERLAVETERRITI